MLSENKKSSLQTFKKPVCQRINYLTDSRSRTWRAERTEVLLVQQKAINLIHFFCPALVSYTPALRLVLCLMLLWGVRFVLWYLFLGDVFLWTAVEALRRWSVQELCSGALSRTVLQRTPAATTVPSLSPQRPSTPHTPCCLTLVLPHFLSVWSNSF